MLSECAQAAFPAGVVNILTGGDELEATRVVGMSGRLSDGQIARLSSEGFEGALRKPFTVRQVIDAIEQAVAVVY